MRSFVVAAVLAHWAVQASANPLTPAECRGVEPSMGLIAVTLRQQVQDYARWASGLLILIEKDGGDSPIGGATAQVMIRTAQLLEAQVGLAEAVLDLQQKIRLCGHRPEAAPATPGR